MSPVKAQLAAVSTATSSTIALAIATNCPVTLVAIRTPRQMPELTPTTTTTTTTTPVATPMSIHAVATPADVLVQTLEPPSTFLEPVDQIGGQLTVVAAQDNYLYLFVRLEKLRLFMSPTTTLI